MKSASFDLHGIRVLPQAQQVVEPDHQHVPEHVHRGIHQPQLAAVDVSPLHSHLRSRNSEPVAQEKQLHVKGKPFDMKGLEQQLRGLSREELEAALSIFAFYAQKERYYTLKNRRYKLSVPLALHLPLVVQSARSHHHHERIASLQFFQLLPDMLKLREGSGSVGINHEGVFSSHKGHTCSDCASLASIFGVFDDH